MVFHITIALFRHPLDRAISQRLQLFPKLLQMIRLRQMIRVWFAILQSCCMWIQWPVLGVWQVESTTDGISHGILSTSDKYSYPCCKSVQKCYGLSTSHLLKFQYNSSTKIPVLNGHSVAKRTVPPQAICFWFLVAASKNGSPDISRAPHLPAKQTSFACSSFWTCRVAGRGDFLRMWFFLNMAGCWGGNFWENFCAWGQWWDSGKYAYFHRKSGTWIPI